MKIPIHYISKNEFDQAPDIFKIINHSISHYYVYFEINSNKYYVGYFSPVVKVDVMMLENENYLLVGVDLKAVVLCSRVGNILFSIGLASFFKGFENTNTLAFTIFTDLDDIIVSKANLSIAQIVGHDLQF